MVDLLDRVRRCARHRTRALVVFGVLLGLYLATGTYDEHQVTDTRAAAVAAWSLGTQGSLYLPEDLENVPWPGRTETGRVAVARFPGPILWGAPFYAVWPTTGVPEEADEIPFGPAGVAAAVATALAVALLVPMWRELSGNDGSWFGVFALGLGSSIWSVSADALWTHGPALVGIALVLRGLVTGGRIAIVSGGLLGVLARPTLGLPLMIIAAWWLFVRERNLGAWLVGSVMIAIIGLTIYTYFLFGTWAPSAGYDPVPLGSLPIASPVTYGGQLVAALASPTRGLLVTSPWLIPLLIVVGSGWQRAPDWVRVSAVAGVGYGLVQLALYSYTAGRGFFGARFLIETLFLASPLLVTTWSVLREDQVLRRVTHTLVVVAILVSLAGTTVFDSRRREPRPIAIQRAMAEGEVSADAGRLLAVAWSTAWKRGRAGSTSPSG